MKVWDIISKVMTKVWRFSTIAMAVCFGVLFLLFCLSMLMPDRVMTALEIIRRFLALWGLR